MTQCNQMDLYVSRPSGQLLITEVALFLFPWNSWENIYHHIRNHKRHFYSRKEMTMKTDIQIAQEATLLPIREVAAKYGIAEDDLELY